MTLDAMLWAEFHRGYKKLNTTLLSPADGESAVAIAYRLYGKTTGAVTPRRASKEAMCAALCAILTMKKVNLQMEGRRTT